MECDCESVSIKVPLPSLSVVGLGEKLFREEKDHPFSVLNLQPLLHRARSLSPSHTIIIMVVDIVKTHLQAALSQRVLINIITYKSVNTTSITSAIDKLTQREFQGLRGSSCSRMKAVPPAVT